MPLETRLKPCRQCWEVRQEPSLHAWLGNRITPTWGSQSDKFFEGSALSPKRRAQPVFAVHGICGDQDNIRLLSAADVLLQQRCSATAKYRGPIDLKRDSRSDGNLIGRWEQYVGEPNILNEDLQPSRHGLGERLVGRGFVECPQHFILEVKHVGGPGELLKTRPAALRPITQDKV